MTLHITTNDPTMEQTVLQALQAGGATVVLLEGRTASTEPPAPSSGASGKTPQRRPRHTPHLSVREYVQNVMGVSPEPLTTRQITEAVNTERQAGGRRPINSRAVYNVLYRATKDGNMVHLANGTWQRLPMPTPGVR